jgi:hypothetical protein
MPNFVRSDIQFNRAIGVLEKCRAREMVIGYASNPKRGLNISYNVLRLEGLTPRTVYDSFVTIVDELGLNGKKEVTTDKKAVRLSDRAASVIKSHYRLPKLFRK